MARQDNPYWHLRGRMVKLRGPRITGEVIGRLGIYTARMITFSQRGASKLYVYHHVCQIEPVDNKPSPRESELAALRSQISNLEAALEEVTEALDMRLDDAELVRSNSEGFYMRVPAYRRWIEAKK